MRYETGGAFRMALESRLRSEALETGVPLARLRKTVAFDRLLARMTSAPQAGHWLLKGGFALQARMHEGARTTKDIDVLLRDTSEDAHRLLAEASKCALGDWFEFEAAQPQVLTSEMGIRVPVNCRLDSREFESFHVDIGLGDPVVADAEPFVITRLLEFAEIPPTNVPCYPISQHLAEKIHALTRPHGGRVNSRVKDLVDVAIIAEASELESRQARRAIQATFEVRNTHSAPAQLPSFPRSWDSTYRKLAAEVGVGARTLADGVEIAEALANPLLDASASGTWIAAYRSWR